MVEAWYDSTINKIRFVSEPGGEALTIEQAEQRLTELEDAINQARSA